MTSCWDLYQLTKQENPLMLKYCGGPQWFTKCGSVVVLNSQKQSGDPHKASESNMLNICWGYDIKLNTSYLQDDNINGLYVLHLTLWKKGWSLQITAVVCWFVSRTTQKLPSRFGWNSDGGRVSAQNRILTFGVVSGWGDWSRNFFSLSFAR